MVVFAAAGLLSGCGENSDRSRVHGKVTLDGRPLPAAVITFTPASETKGPLVGGQIENGSYSLKGNSGPLPGSYHVLISQSTETGEMFTPFPGEAPTQRMEESIPDRYNSKTILQVDIEKGSNEHNFELTTSK